MGCSSAGHDQELWGWVGEMTRWLHLSCMLDQENWTNSKKKKNQHRAKEFPIETQVATSMKGVQVKSTHKLGSGDYPVGYWVDHFVWLKLNVVLGVLRLLCCRTNPLWKGRICDYSCISLYTKLNLHTLWWWGAGSSASGARMEPLSSRSSAQVANSQ